MSFEFPIPVARDDLLNKSGINQYVVDEIFSLRELPAAVQDVKTAYRNRGPKCILDQFDTFFSILCLQKDVDTDLKEDAWQHIIKIATSLSNELSTTLEETDLEPSRRTENLNMVKMTCYLLCQFIEMFESEETKPSTTQMVGPKGRRGKKKTSSLSMDWPKEREYGIKALLHLVQQNINRLWDPPIPEEEFVSLVTNCCYKLLENPEITYVASKDTRDAICHTIAVMVKRYNHALGGCVKIIQLLQHFEHLVSTLAQMVQVCVADYGVKSIMAELMREIGRMDASDLARDTSGTRAYSTFIVEVSEKVPEAVLPNISLLMCHLDNESYSMRNGVLGVMGEILIRVLSKDNLEDKLKTTRDQILDKLEDHIHDIHAFVRSKVLQIWLHIVNEKCLPLPRQEHLLGLVIGRLQDKSSQVRKYAIQLITALLKSNPFAAKLSIEELKANYEKEKEKLAEMMPDEPQQDTEAEFEKKTEEEWKPIQNRIISVLVDLEEDSESSPPGDLIGEEETKETIIDKMYAHIVDGQYREAIVLLTAAQDAWPELKNLTESQPANSETENSDEVFDNSETEGKDRSAEVMAFLKHLYFEKKRTCLVSATESVQTQQETQDQSVVNEVMKQQVVVQYLKDSVGFSMEVQTAIPVISQLLGSKNSTDVMEAIEFFVTGFEFGLTATMIGIRRMLPLIWSKEQGIKEAVVGAYKRLYLDPQGGNQRAKSLAIVKNLSALTVGATLCDLTSLEGLMVELVKSGDISSGVIQVLWERFTMKIAGTTEQESRAAISLLSMIAGADIGVVRSNIDVLVKEGLGPRAEMDFNLARDTCLALLKLGTSKTVKGAVAGEPFRLSETHEMFERLKHILVTGVSNLENQYWITLAEQAVNVIYKLAEYPDSICSDLIKQLAAGVMRTNEEEQQPSQEEADTATADGEENTQTGNGTKSMSCASGILTRMLSLAGHVALRQLVHLDVSVFGELKRRRAIQEEKATKKTPRKDKLNETLSRTKDSTSTEAIEEELGMAGAAAEDAESEYIRKICEYEIVTGHTLLDALRPLLVDVCTNQTKYSDPELRTAATLALAKFMMVSSEFCEAHLQLLFTILEKSPSPVIRANTIIALGDLSFRFPNLIEPWTSHLYARLRDDSPQVRKNTMQVLTHLILNDMIKVKGQISEMATCIVDHDERISSLAKLFFHELAKKGNAVYNVMPDIISRLSDPDVGVDEQNFRIIMKYMFSFIQKDKHCESLVEKLCHRYRATRVDRQWRDLSFCLSMLSYSDKSLRKLQENFGCFADKLADDEVYSCFCTIINKSRSFAKPDAKTLIDELEQRLEQCHKKGLDDDEVAMKASQAWTKKPRTPRNTKTPGRKGRGTTKKGKQKKAIDSDEDEESGDENVTPAPRRTQKARKGKEKPKLVFDSDEDSDIELFEVDKSSKSKSKKGKEKEEESEPSDDEPLSPQNRRRPRGKNMQKRRLNSLNSPLQLSNTPV